MKTFSFTVRKEWNRKNRNWSVLIGKVYQPIAKTDDEIIWNEVIKSLWESYSITNDTFIENKLLYRKYQSGYWKINPF